MTKKKSLFGREEQIKLLDETVTSDEAELLALYGRRRIGNIFNNPIFQKRQVFHDINRMKSGTLTALAMNLLKIVT